MNTTELLAREYDEMMDCALGWAKGNFARFKNWVEKRFIENGPLNCEEIHEKYDQAAVSECGGGSAAVYWYEILWRGRPFYFGWPNTMNQNDYYLISAAENQKRRVTVSNYRQIGQ